MRRDTGGEGFVQAGQAADEGALSLAHVEGVAREREEEYGKQVVSTSHGQLLS